MKLSPHTMMAAVMLATGLVFSFGGSAHAQRATYQTVSGHGYGHGCPCPADCPPAAGGATDNGTTEEGADDMGEDLPDVADLTSDAAMASADQSAAPNAIGDSTYPGYNVNFLGSFYQLDPTGGRRFKATHNNSAAPQCRAFFNYNYYNNAQVTNAGGPIDEIDVHQYEVGGEYAFWCNMASVQVRVPFVDTFASDIVVGDPVPTDVQFGNVQVALKAVIHQDCCSIYSIGAGLDLPTANDINFNIGPATVFQIENEAVLLSPYVAGLKYLDSCTFVQSFAQVSFPLEGNAVNDLGVNVGEIDLPTLLYLDMSVGRWLTQDCCGNGVIGLAELHYTDALTDDAVAGISVGNYKTLNATVGATVVRDCWNIMPALVLPILDENDRAFDYEIAVYVNRRF